MSCSSRHLSRLSTGLLLVGIVGISAAGSVLAAPGDPDTVTQSLTAGPLTASVANLTLPSIAVSSTNQTSTGSMTLSADDSTGSGDGWNVTILASTFAYTGTNGGTDIPAANFSLTSADGVATMTAGQATDPTGGPRVPAITPLGSLSTSRKVMAANAGFGSGSYTQALGVSLLVPAFSRVGAYTGTLTTTISSAP